MLENSLHHWLKAVALRLSEAGVNIHLDDVEVSTTTPPNVVAVGRLTCTHRTTHQEFALEVLKDTSSSALRNHLLHHEGDRDHLFVLTEKISPTASALLRENGVCHADARGNAWLRFDSVLVDLRGQRTTSDEPTRRNRGRFNLFSPSRAKVVMAVIAWPDLLEHPLRELAEAAGVSVPATHDTLGKLRSADFIQERALLPYRLPELLDAWTAAYPTQLGPDLSLTAFESSSPGQWPDLPEGMNAARGGESAVPDLVRPTTTTVYVEEFTPEMAQLNRWRRSDHPNVFVRHKFWKDPHASHGHRDVRESPWPLVYADLLATRDPRHQEVAETWRRTHENRSR